METDLSANGVPLTAKQEADTQLCDPLLDIINSCPIPTWQHNPSDPQNGKLLKCPLTFTDYLFWPPQIFKMNMTNWSTRKNCKHKCLTLKWTIKYPVPPVVLSRFWHLETKTTPYKKVTCQVNETRIIYLFCDHSYFCYYFVAYAPMLFAFVPIRSIFVI